MIPLIAVPIAIIGTFAVMAAFGYSLNNLTLFGLTSSRSALWLTTQSSSIEAVEHHIEHGMSPRDATVRAMDEVSGPVIAIGLVLSCGVRAVCVHHGDRGAEFFRQFAVTIATSTIIFGVQLADAQPRPGRALAPAPQVRATARAATADMPMNSATPGAPDGRRGVAARGLRSTRRDNRLADAQCRRAFRGDSPRSGSTLHRPTRPRRPHRDRARVLLAGSRARPGARPAARPALPWI